MEEKKLNLRVEGSLVMRCKDHSVSGEIFELRKAEPYDLMYTFPVPDADSLAKYYKSSKYISHTNSKNSFREKLYHLVRNLMLRQKLRWINKMAPGKTSLLDIGAGTGHFVSEASKVGWDAEGVEPNPDARRVAAESGVMLRDNLESLRPGKFDVITMWHVLEHVSDLEGQLTLLDDLLAEHGLLIIAVPNYKSWDAQKYGPNWAAFDVPRHLYHFSRKSIREIFGEVGFVVVQEKGLFFDPWYVSLLSESYLGNPFPLFKAMLQGLRSTMQAWRTGEHSSVVYFIRRRDSK